MLVLNLRGFQIFYILKNIILTTGHNKIRYRSFMQLYYMVATSHQIK